MGRGAEGCDGDILVGDIREALQQRANTDGREEADDVEVFELELGQVARDGGVHRGLGVFEFGLVEHLGVFGLLLVGTGEEEFFFAMFGENLDEVGEVLVAEEDFAFAVLYVVLKVVRDGFGRAEVFHGVGDDFAQFFGEAEEVVDRILAVEDDGCVVAEVNA